MSHVRPMTLVMRLSIRTKLLGTSAALIVLCAIGSFVAIGQLGSVKQSGHDLHDKAYTPTVAAVWIQGLAKDLMLQSTRYEKLVLQYGPEKAGTAKQGKPILPAIRQDQKNLKVALASLKAAPPEQQAAAAKITDAVTRYNSALATAINPKSTKDAQAKAGVEIPKAAADIETFAGSFSAASDKFATASNDKIDDAYGNGRKAILLTLLLAVLVGAGLSLRISALLRRSVGDIVKALRSLREQDTADLRRGLDAVAQGDLTVRATAQTEAVTPRSSDEIGTVAEVVEEIRRDTAASIESYNRSLDGLGGMISRVSQGARTLSSASAEMATTSQDTGRAVAEIAHAVDDVAGGAERQVQAVEGARRLTGDMLDAARTSARTADETTKAAVAARELAGEGADAVRQATEAMAAVRDASGQATEAIRGLGAKSEQIGGIVDAITGISEQTNLLALNAAIEAARAGEQGRGFAVVAEEVRKLAEESSKAAGSIAELIREIQAETSRAVSVVELGADRTDQGAQTVEQARAAFERISAQVEEMGARVGEIAAAVDHLSHTSQRMGEEVDAVATVSEQTSAATQQVSASTQQTSTATEQIAASAGTLNQTAEELARLVGEFKLVA
ncbi:methyl-accepting chemotaxis protein [Conexibacter sp. SYSU D00693]|uniref:methyl-accepting chemotaxis protein n=1 Tax=Conexibacter sp. SYSU D00693 TaxID=2812560 RepID=UPI00196A6908|nr:methyl-accepting chemotaxis protein [Conexibacter sp. SYSU D00693]